MICRSMLAAQRFQGHLALTIEIGGAPVGTLMVNTHTPRRFYLDGRGPAAGAAR